MKKRSLKERREAFKQAYRNELAKQGVIDTPKENKPKKVVKMPEKVGEDNGK